MISIRLLIIVIALLVALPVGYVTVTKISNKQSSKMAKSAWVVAFVTLLVASVFVGANAYTYIVNHQPGIVAQRYMTHLIKNSIDGSKEDFEAKIVNIAYQNDDVQAVFTDVKKVEYTKMPALLISEARGTDEKGNVYLTIITEDRKLCMDFVLKPSAQFYDVYEVTIITEKEKQAIVAHERFLPIR